MSQKIFTIISTKGGTGKSTVAVNLSAVLADIGVDVLLIDADEQPTSTRYYQLAHEAEYGLQEFLFFPELISEKMISKTVIDNLDIIRSNNITSEIRHKLLEKPFYASIIRHNLLHPVFAKYDVIIIDTQGAMGPLQTTAAYAANELITPVRPEKLSAEEFLQGTREFIRNLRIGCEMARIPCPSVKALINAHERTRDARYVKEFIEQAIANFGIAEDVSLLNTIIPHSVAYTSAASEKIPAHRKEVERNGKKSETAYETMHQLVYELFPNIAANQFTAQWDKE